MNCTSEYLSIGVSENGDGYGIIGVPWERTSHAFGMNLPDVYITPKDLEDEEIMNKILEFEILGCYVFTPLDDYSFISRFKNVRDVSISHGEKLFSLDFLKDCRECRMLYIEDAKLKNIDVIIDLNVNVKNRFWNLDCVGLFNCEIEDVSRLESVRTNFSEFLIWEYEGKNERAKWKAVRTATFRYYEVKKTETDKESV